ncbi:MAG: acetyl-CoA carboxylase biotin carboxyl carrier protein subunit [Candidatus Wallbacteria bacterium]|nr:acetyl-CoA carboxylase biotin carboxyl carrier protein subunit [Candidatus Wallbacteria bacterium]
MNCRIRIWDKEFKITANELENEIELQSGNAIHRLRWVGNGAFIDGRYHEFEVEYDLSGNPKSVILNGEEFPLVIDRIDSVRIKKQAQEQTVSGKLRANLAGKVLVLAVEAGQKVEAGQLLLILEAMKMENELRAPFAGKIKEIAVEQGKTVSKDQLLLEVER